jgi:hypothetical protein
VLNIIIENKRIYIKSTRKTEIFPYEKNKFFIKETPLSLNFYEEKGKIISFAKIEKYR